MAPRFAIRRSLVLRPLLALCGGTASGSFVEVGKDALRIRFGWMFDNEIALDQIESVRRSSWPWYGGLGWRTTLGGTIAVVGSYAGIVQVRLKRKVRLRFILPFWRLKTDRVVVSLDQPDAFVAALEAALAGRSAT